jgi:hypothetical protein
MISTVARIECGAALNQLEEVMKSQVMDWTEWILVPAAVLLLAALHRLDLVVFIVPGAVLLAYAVTGSSGRRNLSSVEYQEKDAATSKKS